MPQTFPPVKSAYRDCSPFRSVITPPGFWTGCIPYPALRTSVTLIPACGVNAPRCSNPAYVFFFISLFFLRVKKSGKNTLNTRQYGDSVCRVFNVLLLSVMYGVLNNKSPHMAALFIFCYTQTCHSYITYVLQYFSSGRAVLRCPDSLSKIPYPASSATGWQIFYLRLLQFIPDNRRNTIR